jgi:hypothetical protein
MSLEYPWERLPAAERARATEQARAVELARALLERYLSAAELHKLDHDLEGIWVRGRSGLIYQLPGLYDYKPLRVKGGRRYYGPLCVATSGHLPWYDHFLTLYLSVRYAEAALWGEGLWLGGKANYPALGTMLRALYGKRRLYAFVRKMGWLN